MFFPYMSAKLHWELFKDKDSEHGVVVRGQPAGLSVRAALALLLVLSVFCYSKSTSSASCASSPQAGPQHHPLDPSLTCPALTPRGPWPALIAGLNRIGQQMFHFWSLCLLSPDQITGSYRGFNFFFFLDLLRFSLQRGSWPPHT